MFSGFTSGVMRAVRDHCGLPCGVLRNMCISIAVILPMRSRIGQELPHVAHVPEGARLVPDLHHVFAAILLKRRAHPLGVIHRERHGFFLIHVLARIERGAKMLGVKMLRRRDHHRVDRTVLQHAAMIEIRHAPGARPFRALQLLRVNIAEAPLPCSGTRDPVEIRRPIAEADEPDANAVVRAQHRAGTAASVPSPDATLPRKFRRESILGVYQAHDLRRCRSYPSPDPKHRRHPILIMQFQSAEIHPVGPPRLGNHDVIVIVRHLFPITICSTPIPALHRAIDRRKI